MKLPHPLSRQFLRAVGITAKAITCWVFGSWTEGEARAEVNRARAMIGRPPLASTPERKS